MGQRILEAHEVTFSSADKLILDQVGMQLEAGQLHVLLGPNGAGKSSFLKALSGEIVVTEGNISLYGQRLDQLKPEQRARQRAVLPQLAQVNFPLLVDEVIAMGRYPWPDTPSRESRQIVENALQQTDAGHLSGRLYSQLSGGEQQRVQIARVLAQNTDVLLFDEPLSALDLSHQHQCMQLFRKLALGGKGVVVVLHDLNLALRYATHLSLLERGRIVVQGPTECLDISHIEQVFDVQGQLFDCPHSQARQLAIV